MPSTFGPDGRIPRDKGLIIGCLGRKGSGKSAMAVHLFRSFTGDRLVLDIAGDDGPAGNDVTTIEGTADTLPGEWPEYLRKYDDDGRPLPMTLRYVPDPGSPTEIADMDAALAMAATRPGCCVLVHEMGRVCQVHKVPPTARRYLMHNRHFPVNLIWAMPRALGADPLTYGQANLLFIFKLPNPDDRKRVADTIGIDAAYFESAVISLRGHEHLMFDASQEEPEPGQPDLRLVKCSPLPSEWVSSNDRWAWPNGKPNGLKGK